MNTDPNNEPTRETAVFDADEPTEQERELIAKGVTDDDGGDDDDKLEGTNSGAPGETSANDAGEGGGANDHADAAAAALAEEERLAEEQRTLAEKEASEAKANLDVIAKAADLAKPTKPYDFDAKFAELTEKQKGDDLTPDEFARELRKLQQDETKYELAVQAYNYDKERLHTEAEAARSRQENAWNIASLEWENKNQDFMSNPLRAQTMQNAIDLVMRNSEAKGEVMAPRDILTEAQKIAFDYSGYTPPDAVDPKKKVAEAVAGRKQAAPPPTLGDVPNAGPENIKGTEQYDKLEGLGIEELEEVAARMSPAEQEKWLRAAPGAKANGRGDDTD